MNLIEKRARELLAKEHRHDQRRAKGIRIGHKSVSRDDHLAVCAIIAALTPPEGYVLVPVEATGPMKDAVESFAIPHCYLRTGVQIADFNERYRAMLAARPDVP